MFKKIIFFSLFTLILSINNSDNTIEVVESNVFKATILDEKIQFGYSYSTGWSTGPFWIGIHCNNNEEIAGFQFELPDNLQLLDATGGRSQEVFSDLHHNKKGMILGFSMSADKIAKISDGADDMLLKIQVKATSGNNLEFPIKTILAGSNGQKLSFNSTTSNLEIKSDTGEKQLIKVSFYE
tara:strand:+ start:12117 stop:12662 length:546 start_codon:yes stop_codon:yes gene_type:complete